VIKANLHHLYTEAEAPILQGLNVSEYRGYARAVSALPTSNRHLKRGLPGSSEKTPHCPPVWQVSYFKPKSLPGLQKTFTGDRSFSQKVKLWKKQTQELPLPFTEGEKTPTKLQELS